MISKIFHKIKDSLNPKPKFPCLECFMTLKAGGCNEICDLVETDNDKIKKFMEKTKQCIDCGSTRFYDGPSGGMSQNIKCVRCGHEFNFALPLFIERI